MTDDKLMDQSKDFIKNEEPDVEAIYKIKIPGQKVHYATKTKNENGYYLTSKRSVAMPMTQEDLMTVMDNLPAGTTAEIDKSSVQFKMKDIWRPM